MRAALVALGLVLAGPALPAASSDPAAREVYLLPSGGHEFPMPQGGAICDPRIWYSACDYVRAREATGVVRLNGWYKSAASILAASPKACVVAGSDTQVLIHAIRDPRPGYGGYAVTPDSPWRGIVQDDPTYRYWMTRSPWGRAIYKAAIDGGWLNTPAFTTLTGLDLVRFGVPVCR